MEFKKEKERIGQTASIRRGKQEKASRGASTRGRAGEQGTSLGAGRHKLIVEDQGTRQLGMEDRRRIK